MGRRLLVGGRFGRDLAVSVGAALEGTLLALASHGLGAGEITLEDPSSLTAGLQTMARIELMEAASNNSSGLKDQVFRRHTWHRLRGNATVDLPGSHDLG